MKNENSQTGTAAAVSEQPLRQSVAFDLADIQEYVKMLGLAQDKARNVYSISVLLQWMEGNYIQPGVCHDQSQTVRLNDLLDILPNIGQLCGTLLEDTMSNVVDVLCILRERAEKVEKGDVTEAHNIVALQLPAHIWDLLATDAERCLRTRQQHIEAILLAYFGENVSIIARAGGAR